MTYSTLIVEQKEKIGIIRLNRPNALNALNDTLMDELLNALTQFDQQADVSVILLTGSKKAFAAGVDIAQMAKASFIDHYKANYITRNLDKITQIRKPILAAVSGYVLGGGCELAMTCDLIIAADNVQFGQPEVKLGTLPGAGGTQRLTRAIGKAKAMDMCLTGRMMGAEEAEKMGLVARVVTTDQLEEEAINMAMSIANFSQPTLMMIKECINTAFETTLSQGIAFERKVFYASFTSFDQKEGMAAFLEKRPPQFKDC
jgi:enoyl-CoA hydratase